MDWSANVNAYLHELQPIKVDVALARRLVSLIDLTSLNDTDTESSVALFSEQAKTPFGHVAAVCVYPAFTRLMADNFAGSPVKVATVANFPTGDASIEEVLLEVGRALEDGAQEVDVVFPYARFLAGNKQYAFDFVAACKAAVGHDVALKVILETGALNELDIIAAASHLALSAGADFIKTSTGKITEGATLQAAACMLLVIKAFHEEHHRLAGFKASGGIRTVEDAAKYVELADRILGREQVTAKTCRLGSSKLVSHLLQVLG